MADVTPGIVHINQLASEYSLAYTVTGAIAPQVMPAVQVAKQTNRYAIIDKGAWLRRPTTGRNPGEKPKSARFAVSSDSYLCDNYALGYDIPYETLDNADNPLRPVLDGTEFLRTQLAIDYEVRVANTMATGVGSSQTLTGVNAWSDYANSDPILNVRTGRQAIRATTGLTPNLAIIGQKAWDVVQYHPDVVRAVFPGGGGGGTVSMQQFASFLQVDKVLVGGMVYNTAVEGQTDAFTDVWSTHLYLAYVAPNPGLNTPTFGLTFNWVGQNIGRNQPTNFQVMQKDDDEAGVRRIWTGYHADEKIVAPELGFQIRTGI